MKRISAVILGYIMVLLLSSCTSPSDPALDNQKSITSFSFAAVSNTALSSDLTGTINGVNIVVIVPFGTDISSLVATFSMTGESITITSIAQESGITANDFSSPVTYTVNAEDSSTQSYTVTVNVDQGYYSDTIGYSCYIPAGSFQYSSNSEDVCSISSAFRLSECEITRTQFSTIMGTDPSLASQSSGNNDPVQTLNWYHTIAFCNKLSIEEGLSPVYTVSVGGTNINFATLAYASIPTSDNSDWNAVTADWTADGFRLATEMEWQWAALGALSDARQGDIVNGVNISGLDKGYAGSIEAGTSQTNIGDYAWINVDYDGATNPVKQKKSNELGLYDMTGNVGEWTWDRYGDAPSGNQSDYRGPVSGAKRTAKGGHWADWCTNSEYYLYDRGADLDGPGVKPEEAASILGFRVARN